MATPNKNLPPRPTALAHDMTAQALVSGDFAVDATCGNGHDTLHLARIVGPSGTVVAFDVQAAALEETRRRVEAEGILDGRVRLIQACHTTMSEFVAPASAALVMFNLGYLPGGDHELTTTSESTPDALDAAVKALRSGGLLMVTCYPGHPEGAREADAVADWMQASTSHGVRIAHYTQPFSQRPAPILWLAGV